MLYFIFINIFFPHNFIVGVSTDLQQKRKIVEKYLLLERQKEEKNILLREMASCLDYLKDWYQDLNSRQNQSPGEQALVDVEKDRVRQMSDDWLRNFRNVTTDFFGITVDTVELRDSDDNNSDLDTGDEDDGEAFLFGLTEDATLESVSSDPYLELVEQNLSEVKEALQL